MSAQSGDLVLVKTETQEEKGILMPSPNEKAVIIKLDTGYNLGFKKGEVKEISVVEKAEKKETPEKKKLGKTKICRRFPFSTLGELSHLKSTTGQGV